MGCDESWRTDGVTACVRGDNASLYRWAFYFGPVWVVITVVTFLMYWVYYAVRRQERAMAQIQSIPGDKNNDRVG